MFLASIPTVTKEMTENIGELLTTAGHYPASDAPLFIYSYKDLGTSADTNENFFGIIRNDGTPKPAYAAIKQLLSLGN